MIVYLVTLLEGAIDFYFLLFLAYKIIVNTDLTLNLFANILKLLKQTHTNT